CSMKEALMAHLVGRCDCGRKVRFPSGSRLGATWECWTCGRVWTLSSHDRPLHQEKSRAPRTTPSPPPREPPGAGFLNCFVTGVGQGAVVGVVIGILAWCYLAYHLLGPVGPLLVLGALGFSGYHAYRFWSGRRRR
ncbi:MAG TPA: hypothetical protein VKE74_33590, partial [Gemmataceae bacterium]|nr:hypothetical protein [Gemmataceae bacterium]